MDKYRGRVKKRQPINEKKITEPGELYKNHSDTTGNIYNTDRKG